MTAQSTRRQDIKLSTKNDEETSSEKLVQIHQMRIR